MNTHRLFRIAWRRVNVPRPGLLPLLLAAGLGANPTRTLQSTMKGRALLPLKRLEQAGRPAFAPRADESAGAVAVAERIRQDLDLAGTVIPVLTSGGRPGDADRCRRLGIAVYLMKPVKQSELLDAILLAFRTTSGPSRQPLVTRYSLRETQHKLHILLAEDNPVNQALVLHLLEKRGHTVEVVGDGRKVLRALEGTPTPPFDLILMDMQMPEMDGVECVTRIRAKEMGTASRIPIIALTAHAMKGDRERFLAVGMDGYLPSLSGRRSFTRLLRGFWSCPPEPGWANRPTPHEIRCSIDNACWHSSRKTNPCWGT